jgi:hypothetical protein
MPTPQRVASIVLCTLVPALTMLGGCETTSVPASDASAAEVKLDVYGVETSYSGPPGVLGLSDRCCTVRRSAPSTLELPLIASAKDEQSGIRSLEIVATVVRRCTRERPTTAAEGVPTIQSVERVLARAGGTNAAGEALPITRLASTQTTLAALQPDPCPDLRRIVDEDANGQPIYQTVDRQTTTFCGVRIVARAANGVGTATPTASAFVVEGPIGAGALSCPEVPF